MLTVSYMSRSHKIKKYFFFLKNLESSYIWASSITYCASAMFVQFVDMGQKAAQSGGHVLYIGLYRESYHIFYLKPQDLEP